VSRRHPEGLVLDQEARHFLGTTGLVVVGVEAIVLLAIWLVQRYFS
jgi:hypothetical protein